MSEWLFDDLRALLLRCEIIFEACDSGDGVYLRNASKEDIENFVDKLEKEQIMPERPPR